MLHNRQRKPGINSPTVITNDVHAMSAQTLPCPDKEGAYISVLPLAMSLMSTHFCYLILEAQFIITLNGGKRRA